MIGSATLFGEGLRDLALARGCIYNFLATVYSELPSRSLAAGLAEGTLFGALAEAVEDDPCLGQLAEVISCTSAEALANQLCVAYTGLLVGPGPEFVAPYQSVYTDKRTIDYCGLPEAGVAPKSKTVEGLLWGDSTVAVANEYRRAGLELSDGCMAIPDHVGLELQFMQHLCGREAGAWNKHQTDLAIETLRLQRSFLEDYLLKWIGTFCRKLEARAGHPFYRAIAKVTTAFVHSDFEEISIQLGSR